MKKRFIGYSSGLDEILNNAFRKFDKARVYVVILNDPVQAEEVYAPSNVWKIIINPQGRAQRIIEPQMSQEIIDPSNSFRHLEVGLNDEIILQDNLPVPIIFYLLSEIYSFGGGLGRVYLYKKDEKIFAPLGLP